MSSAEAEQPLVLLDDRQDERVDEKGLSGLARRVLLAEGVVGGELSISFVDPEEMADLHVRYMDQDGPTDVLSFPQDPGCGLLGDVVICPGEAAKNNPDVEQELRLLLVHGILHLLGHDHENDAERAAMWAKQERYTGMHLP